MIQKNSRYHPARAFAAPAQGGEAFPGILPRPIATPEGAIEYEVKSGDRLDLLARHFYNQDRLWWRIVDANPDIVFAGTLLSEAMVGQVILIPKAKD